MSGEFGPLRQRNFAVFWCAATVSNGGTWMQMVALPAIVYDMTGKAATAGAVAVMGMIPSLVLTPVGGALADRFSKRRMLLATQSLLMIAAFALYALYQTDHLTLGAIFAITFVNGFGNGLNMPAWNSFIPLLVDRESLLNAVRLNSLQFTVGRVVGPGAAALVISAWGEGAAILTNAITFTMVIAALLTVRPRPDTAHGESQSVWSSVREGAVFVAREPSLRTACLLVITCGCCAFSFIQLCPAIAVEIFDRDKSSGVFLVLGMGFGSMAMSVLMVRIGDRMRNSTTVSVALVGLGLASVLILCTPWLLMGIVGYTVLGVAQIAASLTANSVMQSLSPEQFRGRVVSMYMLCAMSSAPLGALAIGALADTASMQVALGVEAAIVVVWYVGLRIKGVLGALDARSLAGEHAEPISVG